MAQFLLSLLAAILVFLITGLTRFTWTNLASTKRLFQHVTPPLIYAGAAVLLFDGILFLGGLGDFRKIHSIADVHIDDFVTGLALFGAALFGAPFLMRWLIDLVILLQTEKDAGAKDPSNQKADRERPEDTPRWRYRPLRRVCRSTRWTTRV